MEALKVTLEQFGMCPYPFIKLHKSKATYFSNLHPRFYVYIVLIVDICCEFLHQCYHVTIVDNISEVVYLNLKDSTRIFVFVEFGIIFPKTTLILFLIVRLLVVHFNHLLFLKY
jgi:hypothetical protein